jgi:signal transduction histidine kinase
VKQPLRTPIFALSETAESPRIDNTRLEQFLALQREWLLWPGDPERLPARLVQGVATLLSASGAAVGVVEDGTYRVLAAYALPLAYVSRYDGVASRAAELAPVLVGGEPLVRLEPSSTDATPLRTLSLPFQGGDTTGALHVVGPAGTPFSDEDVALARVLAVIAGAALANARQCARLRQLARVRADVLTSMAHDLRAPLNALVGYTSLLREGAFGPLTGEQTEISGILERQALELVDLLGATLDVARLESGHLPIRSEEFAFAAVLEGLTAGTFAQAAREGRLLVRVAGDLPALRTDRVKVKEIVQNLVDNALKHAGGTPVEIDAVAAPERDTVRITVRDRGPGMTPEVLAHVFEPFRPGGVRTSGTGFGLYIVRCFAEALGGRVAAVSTLGEGTAITVELPAASTPR